MRVLWLATVAAVLTAVALPFGVARDESHVREDLVANFMAW
jgi:hypothetical protein